MKQTNDYNTALGIFIKPIIEKEKLRLNPVKICAILRVIQNNDMLNSKVFLEYSREHVFNDTTNNKLKFSKFILLNDILCEKNYCQFTIILTLN